MEKMKCGSCGSDTATLRAKKARNSDGFDALELKCTGCDVTTILEPTRPIIAVNTYDSKGDGSFCIGWREGD